MFPIAVASLAGAAVAQQTGTQKKEYHPSFPLEVCSEAGGCKAESTTITMDANWRWLHNTGGYLNCYNESGWVPEYCPDSDSCCKNCALDGVPQEDWSSTYGVNASSDGGFKLGFVQGGNVGSRFYLLDGEKYRMFNLKNKEFSFDVDVSTLPCGLNGALYFVEMPEDGGVATAKDGLNKAGAKYGTGYCDAQCANDIKFIGGVANIADPPYGSCCAEMDIWESNKEATAYTAHPCNIDGQLRCEADDCGKICDMGGCDFNAYRNGAKTHFGSGSNFEVDSSKPVTVVTQFHTSDGTDSGELSEITRFYIQDGRKIANAKSDLDGVTPYDSITDANCQVQKDAFGEDNNFKSHGGMKAMSDSMERGMVLVMSIWDDNAANMLWLDSVYPPDATGAGAERGPCSPDSGVPADVEKANPDAFVQFSNIKFGEIGSTGGPPAPPTPPPPSPPTPPPSGGCCSWDGKYCGDTTAYCAANAEQCKQCDGSWCTDCLPPYPPSPVPTPVPTPGPSNCPGGSLNACIDLCPVDAYAVCVEGCQRRCPSSTFV